MRVEVIVLFVYFIGMIAMGFTGTRKPRAQKTSCWAEDPWDLSLQL